jgi:hypothetical protein
MTCNIKIDFHTIPLTGLWGNSKWCKASEVAHLCSIMATMYQALDRLKSHNALNDSELAAICFALRRAHEVML